MRREPVVCILLALLLALPGAHAAATVLVTDPANDQRPVAGPAALTPPAMKQVDILQLSAEQVGTGALNLTLTLSAAATDSENLTVGFAIAKGPASLPGSTASGQPFQIQVKGTSATGVTGVTFTRTGAVLSFSFPPASVGAVGGDLLQDAYVFAQDTDGGNAPAPVTQDDTVATDRAPDAGFAATTFAFGKPPVVIVKGDIGLSVTGVSIEATDCAACPREVAGNTVTINATDGSLVVHVLVVNNGATADNVTVQFLGMLTPLEQEQRVYGLSPSGVGAQPNGPKQSVRIAAHGSTTLEFNATFHYPAAATRTFQIRAVSGLGASASASLTITFHPPTKRSPVPAGLGFMSPLVEGMGLDKLLGDYAELGLLIFLVLGAIIVVYLLLFVRHTPWVRVRVHPRRAVVVPGGTAEFRFRLDKAKHAVHKAQAMLRNDGQWIAGIVVGKRDARSQAVGGQAVSVGVEQGALDAEGSVRIEVPANAQPNEKGYVDIDIVPQDADGTLRPEHKSTARIIVETPSADVKLAPKASDIQLASVRHEPIHPLPGGTVTTNATVRNDGPTAAPLRVVLQVDGNAILEERVEVPARGERIVILPWKAGVGKNQVKVQVFLA